MKIKKKPHSVISADDRTLDVGSGIFAAICSSYVKRKSKYLSSALVKQAGRLCKQLPGFGS